MHVEEDREKKSLEKCSTQKNEKEYLDSCELKMEWTQVRLLEIMSTFGGRRYDCCCHIITYGMEKDIPNIASS